jgi:hypothetical protein
LPLATALAAVVVAYILSWYGIRFRREREWARQQEIRIGQEQDRKGQQESIMAKLEPFGPRVQYIGNDVVNLNLTHAEVTVAGLRNLRKALPNSSIRHRGITYYGPLIH